MKPNIIAFVLTIMMIFSCTENDPGGNFNDAMDAVLSELDYSDNTFFRNVGIRYHLTAYSVSGENPTRRVLRNATPEEEQLYLSLHPEFATVAEESDIEWHIVWLLSTICGEINYQQSSGDWAGYQRFVVHPWGSLAHLRSYDGLNEVERTPSVAAPNWWIQWDPSQNLDSFDSTFAQLNWDWEHYCSEDSESTVVYPAIGWPSE